MSVPAQEGTAKGMPALVNPQDADALPFPTTELGAGDRFPNFLLPDQDGKMHWFLERAKGRLLVVFVDPSDADVTVLSAAATSFHVADIDRLAILGDDENAVSRRATSLGANFPLLADANSKIRDALRRMAGVAGKDPIAFLLDANQRVLVLSQSNDLASWALAYAASLPAPAPSVCIDQVAPVLFVPNVLSPAMCRGLINRWEQMGYEEGVVNSVIDGVEMTRQHHTLKRRRDHRIQDQAVLRPLTGVIGRRLAPELDKAFAFKQFKFDRIFISCYEAERGDFFRRHRDNMSASTADRRFAVTLNLNTPDYEGGEVVFPEYGAQRYSPPTGGALLFSCSLLHEALPVTRGQRFALLTFLRA